MKKIGPKQTSQELFIRKIISPLGYRYSSYNKHIPGKPDLVFTKLRKVIFVNGCFWHGHKRCKRSKLPTTNVKFWEKKISGNIKRDKKVKKELKAIGWEYLIIWQCEISKSKGSRLIGKIQKYLST
ncbi:MAG: very short patch repair endonuclease [Bacteroidota bacterium]